MKIKSITLHNFRSFYVRTTIDNLKQVNIFVGPNNAGKSNIILALQLINDLVVNNLPNRPYSHMAFEKDEPITLEIEVELAQFERSDIIEYSLSKSKSLFEKFELEKNNLFKMMQYILVIDIKSGLSSESVNLWDDKEHYFPIMKNEYQPQTGWVRNTVDLIAHLNETGKVDFSNIKFTNTSRGGSPPNQILVTSKDNTSSEIVEYLVQFLKQLKIYSAYRIPSSQLKAGESRLLDSNANNLVKVANTMQSEPEIYKNVIDNFSKIIDNATITAPLVGENATIKMREGSIDEPTNIENVSTGVQQILSLLFALANQKSGLICIEEPEVHLHPTAQRILFDTILEKANKNQFFITTHSSIFTDISDVTATYLVTKEIDCTDVMEINDPQNFRIVKQHLGIRNSDFYGKDYVLFIEGESEEVAMPIIAKSLGYEIGKKVAIFNFHGKGNISNLKHVLYLLKGSDTESFLIADGADGVYKDLEDLEYLGLLKSNVVVWEKEFEDNFSNEIIINAIKKIIPTSIEFRITPETLAESRKTRKVDKILGDYLHNMHDISLNKPALARELALILSEEIRNYPNRTKTYFEEKIEEIMSKIGNKKTVVNS